ncbi:MAG: hypothetical protein H6839_11595 [Planctomycetes bacterium]|nr:hypothetical protein [Planctomycetota bacterium]
MEPADYKPFSADVHDYVGGRMSADAERDFERKLGNNAELKQQVDQLRKSLDLLHTLPMQEPKEGFDQRVIGRIREEELADRARRQIAAAPAPMWQHIVQVGLGAAAAALVLAVIGVPGMFQDGTDKLDGTGGGEAAAPVARVSATEDDLLPALADHNARFESLRRNVAHTSVSDPDLQRQFLSMELQYSDLQRRNRWLADQVAGLPSGKRVQYERFLEKLESALAEVSEEVSRSSGDRRPVDMKTVMAALDRVQALQGEVSSYTLSANGGSIVPDGSTQPTDTGKLAEVGLYALVRRADYRHDNPAVIDAASVYLGRFPQGYFVDEANAASIAAHLRLGEDDLAAKRFKAGFGDYDEDVKPGQLAIVRGLLTPDEYERLGIARKALREHE